MILGKKVAGLVVTKVVNGRVQYTKDGVIGSMRSESYRKHVRNATIDIPRYRTGFSEETRNKVIGQLEKEAISEAAICLKLGWIPDENSLSIIYTIMRQTSWVRLPSGVWYSNLKKLPLYMTDPNQTSFHLEKTAPRGHVYDFSFLSPKPEAEPTGAEDPINARLRLMQNQANDARRVRDEVMKTVQSRALRLQALIPAMALEIVEQAKQNAVSRAFGETVVKNEHPACSEFFKAARALQELTH